VTIPEVLRRAGHPEGRRWGERWRTTCPLHRGQNEQAFSYTLEVWHCFRCDESGGVRGLADRLGVLEEPVARPPLEGVPELRDLRRPDRSRPFERPTAILARLAAHDRARVLAQATVLHQLAEEQQAVAIPRWLDEVAVDYQDDPDGRLEAFEEGARWWAEAQGWKDLAHELFVAVAFDPVLAEVAPQTACSVAEAACFCLCAGAVAVPRGARTRPRLGDAPR